MSVLKKLDDFKSKVGKLKKNGDNPFHKSKYATLDNVIDTIEEPMREAGIGYYQTTEKEGLITTIYDLEDTKLAITGFLPFIGATDMQKLGSAITYNRRYALVTMLGLEQEDDDGNKASGYSQKPQQQNNAPKEYINKAQAKELNDLCINANNDINVLMQFFKASRLGELTTKQFGLAKYKISQNEFLMGS